MEPAVLQATQLREDLMFSYQKSSPGRQQPKAVRFTTADVVKDREQNQPRTVAIWLGCTYKSKSVIQHLTWPSNTSKIVLSQRPKT